MAIEDAVNEQVTRELSLWAEGSPLSNLLLSLIQLVRLPIQRPLDFSDDKRTHEAIYRASYSWVVFLRRNSGRYTSLNESPKPAELRAHLDELSRALRPGEESRREGIERYLARLESFVSSYEVISGLEVEFGELLRQFKEQLHRTYLLEHRDRVNVGRAQLKLLFAEEPWKEVSVFLKRCKSAYFRGEPRDEASAKALEELGLRLEAFSLLR